MSACVCVLVCVCVLFLCVCGCVLFCACVCVCVDHLFAKVSFIHAGAPGMHDSAWCNEAPVMHQDMVEGRFSHVPAKAAP